MQKIVDRMLRPLIEKRLSQFPAVALLGPRQSGKTTLARSFKGIYFDLEREQDREKLKFQWPDLMEGKELLILDEAQRMPEFFTELRAGIDAQRKLNGRFLLLGSMSMHLIKQINESLAGRVAQLELTPFLLEEVGSLVSVNDLWMYGGFPDGGLFDHTLFPVWQDNYLQRLFYIDFQNWNIPLTPPKAMQLMKMLAALHGQQWNASDVGRSLGLNYQTVNSYADYLEGAFIARRLAAFHANLKKRLTKSPKIYVRDTGLLHEQLGLKIPQELLEQPWRGASWEGFVIEMILNTLSARGILHQAYYLRTLQGEEIDLIVDFGTVRWAIEIKLSKKANLGDLAALSKKAEWIEAKECFLISMDPQCQFTPRGSYCDLMGFFRYIQSSGAL